MAVGSTTKVAAEESKSEPSNTKLYTILSLVLAITLFVILIAAILIIYRNRNRICGTRKQRRIQRHPSDLQHATELQELNHGIPDTGSAEARGEKIPTQEIQDPGHLEKHISHGYQESVPNPSGELVLLSRDLRISEV